MSLRIALLHGGGDEAAGAYARALAETLRARGHDVTVVGARSLRPVERVLRARGFTGPLTHVPFAAAVLTTGRFDVAHALSAPDAAAALAWRRARGGRVVFTCVEALDRATVADRRLRLTLLRRALHESDAVAAAGEEARAALWRWMALEAPVLDARDASGHEQLYAA